MRYLIIQTWRPIRDGIENSGTVTPAFLIVGEPYGYNTVEDARAAKEKLQHSDWCIIIQTFQ